MGNYVSGATSLSSLMIGTTLDTATVALVNKCIDWAETEVNKYLSRRYDIVGWTSGSTPPIVVTWTERLALIHTSRRKARGGMGDNERKLSQDEYNEVLANLKQVADYQLDIFNTAGSVIADSTTKGMRVLCNTSDYIDTFAEDDPLNWSVDTNKLDDIESDRA